MNVKEEIIKQFCLRMLPEKALLIFKKFHYYRTLKAATLEDEVDLKIIEHIVKSGDHVIDIGANFGIYTKFLSDFVGIHGRVYSIEPVPLTYNILKYNIKRLGLTNVNLINFAISSIERFVTMDIPTYESGGRNYYRARIIEKDVYTKMHKKTRVEAKTIDSLFLKDSYDISFIKCDVEGHELECIKGSIEVIENSKPAWLIEISGNPDDPKSLAFETFKHLLNYGYEVHYFNETSLKKRCFGEMSVNYFFLTSRHLEMLKENKLLSI